MNKLPKHPLKTKISEKELEEDLRWFGELRRRSEQQTSNMTPADLREHAIALRFAMEDTVYEDFSYAHDWQDKAHRVVWDAASLIEWCALRIEQLQEYLNAAASDYEGAMETLRNEGKDFMPKTVLEMANSVTMLRKASNGEDIWSQYQCEMNDLKEQYLKEVAALEERIKSLENIAGDK